MKQKPFYLANFEPILSRSLAKFSRFWADFSRSLSILAKRTLEFFDKIKAGELTLKEGDAAKHFSEKQGFSSEKGGGNSVNEEYGKDFSRKGNSEKRFRPFTDPPDSENGEVAVLIPFPKISS